MSRPDVARAAHDGTAHLPAEETTAAIADSGLIAVLRSGTAQHYRAVTEALVEAGVRTLEITLTAHGALSALEHIAKDYHGSDVLVGAGTVVDATQAEMCLEAGATFLVSPAYCADVLAVARIAETAVYPGAMTPTEILTAHRGGASAVKLFPAAALSPRYLLDVHAPLPEITIMPTGGIDIDDIPAWIRAGAGAVGLGSPLLGRAVDDGPAPDLRERARRAVAAVAEARA
ncbi:bifunctional 4-hydroxy-2-oxoglutarate aldolase/2-dehydro-3-deoxy-phosphogluconate aldolase [Pseudonocardia sp. CA-107938]|uniref:bifunctional 4-hydroxy-2-oxoglutarate aldolase/2-dehydro-3-deoxy-phosphogluconate aldolase n=1 Tax=Pseudonocardia sp. CA-107938 TaxID=3240021 RepID=UPI003D8A4D31